MEETTIQQKLLTVQQSLVAPKGQHNSFGNYNYRSCEDILNAVKPLLKEQGLTIVIEDHLENIGDRYYVKATVYLGDGKTAITAQAYAREEETKKGMDASQITGAASSYARKYALNGLFAIDDTKDADSQDNSTHATKTAKSPSVSKPLTGMATDKQRETIKQNLMNIGIALEDQKGYLIEQYGVEIPLTKEGASFVIENLFAKQS